MKSSFFLPAFAVIGKNLAATEVDFTDPISWTEALLANGLNGGFSRFAETTDVVAPIEAAVVEAGTETVGEEKAKGYRDGFGPLRRGGFRGIGRRDPWDETVALVTNMPGFPGFEAFELGFETNPFAAELTREEVQIIFRRFLNLLLRGFALNGWGGGVTDNSARQNTNVRVDIGGREVITSTVAEPAEIILPQEEIIVERPAPREVFVYEQPRSKTVVFEEPGEVVYEPFTSREVIVPREVVYEPFTPREVIVPREFYEPGYPRRWGGKHHKESAVENKESADEAGEASEVNASNSAEQLYIDTPWFSTAYGDWWNYPYGGYPRGYPSGGYPRYGYPPFGYPRFPGTPRYPPQPPRSGPFPPPRAPTPRPPSGPPRGPRGFAEGAEATN